jgi:hypothetical protein
MRRVAEAMVPSTGVMERLDNRLVSKVRAIVERSFGME